MKISKYYLFFCLFIITFSYAQDFAIQGKVIDTDLLELPGVQIFSITDKLIATTDLNGNFNIENITGINSLKFRLVGTVDEIVQLNNDCKYVQLIMFYDSTHCFVSEEKLKKIEKREQRKKMKFILKLSKKAVSKKLFDEDKMCNQQKV